MAKRSGSAVAVVVLAGVAWYFLARRSEPKLVGMAWPVIGRITSPFGIRIHPVTLATTLHNGIDIAAPSGDPVRSPFDGRVRSIYTNDAGGLQMVVDHANGFTTGYAHLSDTVAPVGAPIARGQLIARVGASGRVTGPHLHFTMRNASGSYVDPLPRLS